MQKRKSVVAAGIFLALLLAVSYAKSNGGAGQGKELSVAVGDTMSQSSDMEIVVKVESETSSETESQPETESETESQQPDTKAPVIKGTKDITIYAGDSVSYRKGVTATDDVDGKVDLSIDSSKVDRDTPGTYVVTYSAVDAAGNRAKKEITLTVLEKKVIGEEDVIPLADKVIADVVPEGTSKYDTAYKLFRWCKKNLTYSYSAGDRSSVWAGAYEGLHDKTGDCFVYYATYEVLLTRAGIDNMKVSRVDGDSNHWWNLVNTGNGWYHCDTSPRNKEHPYTCFMQTDEQVAAYTESYPEKPNYYNFDSSLYPERATEIIYGN